MAKPRPHVIPFSRHVSNRPSQFQKTYKPLHEYKYPSKDRNGNHSERRFLVPPELARQVSVVLDSKKLPCETESEVDRLFWIEGMKSVVPTLGDPKATELMLCINAKNDMLAEEMQRAAYEADLQWTLRALDALIKRDADRAFEVIDQVWRKVKQISDPYWGPRYRKAVGAKRKQLRAQLEDE